MKRIKEVLEKYVPTFILIKIKILYAYIFNKKNYEFYENINLDLANLKQKRAIIAFVPEFFKSDVFSHGAVSEFIEIVYCLIQYGYVLDIIDVRDDKKIKLIQQRKYDLVFGLESNNIKKIMLWNKNAKKVVYSNGPSIEICVKNEIERFEYLKSRHMNIKTAKPRTKDDGMDCCLKYADELVLLGNKWTGSTYWKWIDKKNIYLVDVIALQNVNYIIDRNVRKSKNRFLWFGSSGTILKGLDIVIDVFNDLKQCELYIYGVPNNEQIFVKNMIKGNNIYLKGFIHVNSKEFINLINSVSFIIFPSSGEGMSGSVATCMKHGLIPIITKETGVDLPSNAGFMLSSFYVNDIKKMVEKCLNLTETEIEYMHNEILKYTKNKYTTLEYKESLLKIFDKILDEDIKNR